MKRFGGWGLALWLVACGGGGTGDAAEDGGGGDASPVEDGGAHDGSADADGGDPGDAAADTGAFEDARADSAADGAVDAGSDGSSSVDAMLLSNIDVGLGTTCGIGPDSGLWCWGRNRDGETGTGGAFPLADRPQRVGSELWKQVSAGARFTCAVRADDTLWCWGFQGNGRLGNAVSDSSSVATPVQVGTDDAWRVVSASQGQRHNMGHACAVRGDDTLWCWGANGFGQLGTGDKDDSSVPVRVGDGGDWLDVVAGHDHTCARRRDRSAYCWGRNLSQQLGEHGSDESLAPVEALAGARWSALSAGRLLTCGVRDDGSLWCWGGLFPASGGPAQVGADNDWLHADVSGRGLCGVRAGGTTWCGGDNTFGQAGVVGEKWLPELRLVPGVSASRVTVSEQHTCAADDAGRAFCFGGNFHGELGRGVSALKTAPAPIVGDAWDAARTSSDTGCGIRSGALWCWGQTGLDPADHSAVPVAMGVSGFVRIEGGREAQCGIRDDDSLWCWGRTYFDPIGMTGVGFYPTPAELMPDTLWRDVALGERHVCGIRADQSLWCWGRNAFGQVGDGTTDDAWDALQVGTDRDWENVVAGGHTSNDGSTCAIKTDGTLWCWGGRVAAGLTGASSPEVTAPTQVGEDDDWADAAMGWGSICALKDDGAMHCAGQNDSGQLGDPDRPDPDWALARLGTASWSDVAVGSRLACAVRADGTLWCWGDGRFGQLGLAPARFTDPLLQATPLQVGTENDWDEVQISLKTTLARHTSGQVDALGFAEDGAHGCGDAWSATPTIIGLP